MIGAPLFSSSLLHLLVLLVLYKTALSSPIQTISPALDIVEPRGNLPLGATFVPDTGLVLRKSVILAVISPSYLAAQTFGQFYLDVLAKALSEWQLGKPALDNLFYTQGLFTLVFVADTPGKPIPWNFVASFCQQMVDWTNRGFTGTFDRGYWNLDETFGVFAGFRVGDWMSLFD